MTVSYRILWQILWRRSIFLEIWYLKVRFGKTEKLQNVYFQLDSLFPFLNWIIVFFVYKWRRLAAFDCRKQQYKDMWFFRYLDLLESSDSLQHHADMDLLLLWRKGSRIMFTNFEATFCSKGQMTTTEK